MTNFQVFKGDADGLCALPRLCNAQPREAQLYAGVKRDINDLRVAMLWEFIDAFAAYCD